MKFVEGPHSPAPFRVVRTSNGHLLVDQIGDSIGALAASTGDHPEHEQLANALLFRAAPELRDLVVELVLELMRSANHPEPDWALALIDPATRLHEHPAGDVVSRAEALFATLEPGA